MSFCRTWWFSLRVAIVAFVFMSAASVATTSGLSASFSDVAAQPGRYVVELRGSGDVTPVVGVLEGERARVFYVYRHAISGFAAELSSAELTELRADPVVASIVPDVPIMGSAVQRDPSWGLDRVDQRYLPLDHQYRYDTIASGVKAYIIDSGIAVGNPDFGTRRVSGIDEVGGVSPPTNDCSDHGSLVAGIVGGSRYGVAKGVTLVAVRVINCNGGGALSQILAGIDWVTGDHRPGQPAVASLSLGSEDHVPVLDAAIANSIAHGITYTVAAGNARADDAEDACVQSPSDLGGSGPAITVAASDGGDARAEFSDFGRCVDIFAPGTNIMSDGICGPTFCTVASATGTSFAAPFVAGIAALYLARHPTASPAQVKRAVLANAIVGVVRDARGTPNRLAWSSPLSKAGYWLLGSDGSVYSFGGALYHGATAYPAWRFGASAIAIAATDDGTGYRIADAVGAVHVFGSARFYGDHPALNPGERVSAISSTRLNRGYWLFTSRGRVIGYGDAHFYGDMHTTALQRPVIASAATPTDHGYFMVAADGGVFSFGDARFRGSMGNTHLNQPVVSIALTPDNNGYWLVASDGGVFAFHAPFHGSMGAAALNKPVNGLVAYGNGYLMVASDGGIFNFSNKPFLGSLGNHPPSAAIIGVAAFTIN